MKEDNRLQVYYEERRVGTLALAADHKAAFQYAEKEDKWHLSPAYDLTYSNTYYGEHTTMVDGNGRNPGKKELLAVGIAAGMKKGSCEKIIDEIQAYVKQMLWGYLERC